MIYLLSDAISRLNIGGQRKSSYVILLNSRFCVKNLLVIYALGFIAGIKLINLKYFKTFLKYYFGSSCIRSASVLSKKKFQIYASKQSLKNIIYKNKFLTNGHLILSVSHKQAICLDTECLMLNIGGKCSYYIN